MPASPENRSYWPRWDENKLMTALLAFLMLYAAGWLLIDMKKTAKESKEIGKPPEMTRTITVNGTGKITATPTIARISVGVLTEGGKDIAVTQTQNSTKMNGLIAELKSLGIAAADVQTTNYSIYPRYEYTDGKSTLIGYTVSQNVNVKVRDLEKVSAVFEKAGAQGANQVNGPDFTIDDPESLQADARAKAIEDAKMKAAALSGSLGVHVVRVVSYGESDAGGPVLFEKRYALSDGIGGGATAPQIESGSLDVVANVSVTYEIE